MPIQPLPQGLGNAFTERVDTSPLLQFSLQQKARKQALEEASNQYFNKLVENINTAGVRNQDLDAGEHGGILNDIELWKHNYIQNKDAIKKGGWAQQQSQADYEALMRKIAQSKNRAQFELGLGKAKFEGTYEPDEDDLNVIGQVSKSIYDPSSYKQDGVSEYGYGDLPSKAAEFDADKQAKFFTAAQKGMMAGKKYDYTKSYKNPNTGQVIVPFKEMFTPDQIKRSADEASRLAADDKSAKKHYKKRLENPESEDWQRLNQAYQSVYGKDKFVHTPEQAAAADAIMRFSAPQKEGEEQELNYQQRQDDKRTNIYINQSRAGSGGGGNPVGNALDDFENAEYGNFNIKDGAFYKKDGSLYSGDVFVTAEKIPGSVKTALKSGGFDIAALGRGANAKVVDGEIVSISNKNIGTITRKAMEGVYQPKTDTEPLKGKRLEFSDKDAPKTKPTAAPKISDYDIPKGAKIKYAADGKTPLGYELNGKKYKF